MLDNKINSNVLVSVVLPCRNEEKFLKECIELIKNNFNQNNINGEIIVSDSSSDSSPKIAQALDVILHKHDKEGYGRALLEGFSRARGKYIFFADPDGTYDFSEISRFLRYLDEGYDFVIGNRFKGEIQKGAMPWLHKHVGNPVFFLIFRIFFKTNIHDVHCGMRACTLKALKAMNLQTTGMEFASEMIVKASRRGLKIKELPINYRLRQGQSKLKTFSDGWRHLRLILLYSPLYLFFVPGLLLFFLGAGSIFWLRFFTPSVFGITFFFHPMFISSLFIIIGYQFFVFALFAQTYAMTHLGEQNKKLQKFYKYFTLEKGLFWGVAVGFIGVLVFSVIIYRWVKNGFGEIDETKNFIVALTMAVIGLQTIFSSFMLSILSIKEK